MTKAPLILFDLIATITDAGPRYAKSYCAIAERYGINVPKESAILNELGQNHLKGIIAIHSPDLPEPLIENFIADCNKTCDSMLHAPDWVERLYPNVKETLAFLKSQGFMLGIYTGTREDAAMAQLKYHGILDFFEPKFIKAKDSRNSHYKKSADLKSEQIDEILALYSEIHECTIDAVKSSVVVVGDTFSDFEAAKSKGLPFIGFANSPRKVFSLARQGILDVFESYEDAPAKITAILGATELVPPIQLQASQIKFDEKTYG